MYIYTFCAFYDCMKKKYSLIYVLFRTEKDIFQIAPLTAIIMIVSLFIQSFVVGVQTLCLSTLFGYAEKYLTDETYRIYMIKSFCALIIVFLIRQIANAAFMSSMTEIDAKVLYKLNMRLCKKCASIPMIFFEDPEWRNELTRAKQCLKWTRLSDLSLSFYNILSELLSMTSVLLVIASFNLWLILISIFSVLPFIIVRLIRGEQFYKLKWFQASQERKKAYYFNLFNNKQAVKEIKVMNVGEYLFDNWNKLKNIINDEEWEFRRKDLFSLLACDCISVIGYLICVIFVIYLTSKGMLGIGMLTSCMIAFKDFQENMKYILINIGRIPEHAAFCSDYYQFMDKKEEGEGKIKLDLPIKKIQLQNVSFSYPCMTQNVLEKININIEYGEKVVILGENGSGKTTLAKLLLGIYKAQTGTVKYNDILIEDINKELLYKQIAIVGQDFTQYSLTLKENIAFSDENSKKINQKIMDILEFLDIKDILNKEDGINMRLGREFGGEDLSKGQWQKIAIARAIYKNGQVVFWDEPTSALDPIIETQILRKFLEIAEGKTAIIVSHRTGLCKDVNKIIVMKNGKIVEEGNHKTLYGKKGEYYRLYTSQSKWYL